MFSSSIGAQRKNGLIFKGCCLSSIWVAKGRVRIKVLGKYVNIRGAEIQHKTVKGVATHLRLGKRLVEKRDKSA